MHHRTRSRRNPTWGKFNEEQKLVVLVHVLGEIVCDLGAHDLVGSQELLDLGATFVYAYDYVPMGEGTSRIWTDSWARDYVNLASRFSKDMCGEAALLSWPSASLKQEDTEALITILSRCPKVMYLGKNTDGTACGNPALFRYFLTREVLDHVPDPKNTLIVYGGKLEWGETRPPLAEEVGALSRKVVSYAKSVAWARALAGRHKILNRPYRR